MKKLLILLLVFISTLSFAQKAGDIYKVKDGVEYKYIAVEDGGLGDYEYYARTCNKKGIQSIIIDKKKDQLIYSVDKNAILRKDGSTAYNIAAAANMKKCRDVARWLSDIGVKDGMTGGGYARIEIPHYKKPYIFENEHIKITFTNIETSGHLVGTLYNKTDDNIQYVGQIYTVNGKTDDRYFKNSPLVYKPDESKAFWLAAYDFDEHKSQDGPKVVKNKITIKKEDAIFIYRYKDKEYSMNLKIGGTETHDVYYTNDSITTQHDAIRKEQLGY